MLEQGVDEHGLVSKGFMQLYALKRSWQKNTLYSAVFNILLTSPIVLLSIQSLVR